MDRRIPFPGDFELILASQSPRRHSLLRDIGVPFRVVVSDAEEVLDGNDARSIAEANALLKLEGAVLPEDVIAGAFVMATDTIVTVGGRAMGKAGSEEEAASMLASLSGRTHQVVSGVALARSIGDRGSSGTIYGVADSGGARDEGGRFPGVRVASAVTDVSFVDMGESDIAAYVASGEWRGKAGAYAIQGLAGLYTWAISGEYSNVVGLPLALLRKMFREQGFDLVRRTWL